MTVRDDAWPTLSSVALRGLPGEFVNLVEPNSEADPAALLVQFLVACGSAIGRSPYVQIEGDRHTTNLFALIVGNSAKARKGTSWGRVRQVMDVCDEVWASERVMGGLSSGEGVIHAVRDASEPDADGPPVPGVDDKRLLVTEGEFAQALRTMARSGNTLSATLRNLWDRGKVGTLTKGAPTRTSNAHVSIIGHITVEELRKETSGTTEAVNGFANRFIIVAAQRSKRLAFGGDVDDDAFRTFAERVRTAIGTASAIERVGFTDGGAAAWMDAYHSELAVEHPGLLGAITARSEAQTLRLALLYAVLDGRRRIEAGDVAAALAVWRYSVASARVAFASAPTTNNHANKLYAALASTGGKWVTKKELRDILGSHNIPATSIDQALLELRPLGLVEDKRASGGRPVTVYRIDPLFAHNAHNAHAGSEVAA